MLVLPVNPQKYLFLYQNFYDGTDFDTKKKTSFFLCLDMDALKKEPLTSEKPKPGKG